MVHIAKPFLCHLMRTLQGYFITRDPYNLLQLARLPNFKNFLVISPQEKELENFKAKRLNFHCEVYSTEHSNPVESSDLFK